MAPKATTPNPFTEIEEYNQANNLVATYIQSPSNPGLGEKGSRIDVVIPQNTHSYARSILNAFLPAGYPNSVTSDYLEYQIYDSLQAFSSSIAGLLSSRAVLEGIGVGDVSASPTSALLLSVLQDSMGRIATILFAHRLGTALEPECKMYRLLADVFNDTAMVLDCLSPVFPRGLRVGVLGGSSVLRALCGVAAGSSKASLSAHFAMEGNLGELNAKDSSQETVISLLGMLVGTVVVSHITSKSATWTALLFLLAIHLGTNYLAVRAVCMRTLNRQRANLVFGMGFEGLVVRDEVGLNVLSSVGEGEGDEGRGERRELGLKNAWPAPEWVRRHERVFERDGVLRLRGRKIGWCEVGISLQRIIASLPNPLSTNTTNTNLTQLLELFKDAKYILSFDSRRDTYLIVLKEGAGSRDVIEAWMLVFLVAMCRDSNRDRDRDAGQKGSDDWVGVMEKCKVYLERVGASVMREMGEVGWDLDIAALETRSGVRVRVKE